MQRIKRSGCWLKSWQMVMQHSHSLVSLGFTLAAYALGFNPVVAALIISAYWAAYYNPKAWNVKSFWWDMSVPFVLSYDLAYVLLYVI